MLSLDEEKQKQHAAAAKQEAAQEREATVQADIAAKRDHAIAPDGARPTTDLHAQMGRVMRGEEVRAKLRKLNSNFHFEVSIADPSRTGIYLRDGVSNMDTPSHKGLRFLLGMEREYCPEFSVRMTKEERYWDDQKDCEATREIFAGEMRGWRTILARLIQGGHVSYAEALKEFGDTSRSKNWHQLVH